MGVAHLKAVTYEDLMELVPDHGRTTIGHNTHGTRVGDMVSVEYHGNTIAVLAGNEAWLSTHGWDTTTTTGRLAKIARASWPGANVDRKGGTANYTSPKGVRVVMAPNVHLDAHGEPLDK